jgi:hypothetical protein
MMRVQAGRPTIPNSTGAHLYNRVVTEQKLVDRKGPATQRLLAHLNGKDSTSLHYWELASLSPISEMSEIDQD